MMRSPRLGANSSATSEHVQRSRFVDSRSPALSLVQPSSLKHPPTHGLVRAYSKRSSVRNRTSRASQPVSNVSYDFYLVEIRCNGSVSNDSGPNPALRF